MKLGCIYEQIIKFGADRDPRSNKRAIKSYADTQILNGSPDTEVRSVLVGIDMEVGELLLADKIRKDSGLDLVITHHPEGRAWAEFYKVMRVQIEMLTKVGISRQLAEELLNERMGEVERRVLPNNHMRAVDVARLLGMPFMCVHTPADNHVSDFMYKLMNKEQPGRVGDIVDILEKIPEYADAKRENAGPRIISGSANRPVGKIFVEMTGGTEGHKEVFGKLRKKGIRTLVSMHLSEEHLKKVKDADLNVVIAGHISSDTLGLNLLFDRIEKQAKERLHFISCSGFRRIRR